MEEIETFSRLFSLNHNLRKLIILFTNLRQIFFSDSIRICFFSHHRLNRHLLKSQICKMQDIIGKVQIIPGKCPSDIIFLLIPAVRKFLEFGNNQIVTALPVPERTHLIIYFLPPVKTQNHIIHFFIDKLLNLIIQKNPICSDREAEMLVMDFLLLSSICNQILHNLPVHQRLSAKKIHFQIMPVP